MKTKEIREEIAFEFYNARAQAGDMPWSQASAVGGVMVDLAYAKANQILSYLHAQNFRQVESGKLPQTKVICLCGSTRFTEQMMVKQWELTKKGNIVLSWCALPDSYFSGRDKAHIGDQEGVKEIVDEVHLRKIDLADEVLILNIGGYIGESTRRELNYALSKGKLVTYLEKPSEPMYPGACRYWR